MPSARRAAALLVPLFLLASRAAADTPQVEQIEVTAAPGLTNQTSDAPRTVITSAEIARSGAATLDDLLEQIPALGSQGVNGNQNAGGYGEAFADLRNLNFDRTLVLIDGRRMVPSGIRTDEAVDLNSIPLALIDRIEILKDGSQPLYGSDAVAGVINIVLKKTLQGVRLEAYGGGAGSGDDATTSLDLTGGAGRGPLQMEISLGAFDKRPVPQADRAWAAGPITDASFQQGHIATLTGSSATPGGQVLAAGIDQLALGHGSFRPFDAARDQYDFGKAQDLQGGLDRAHADLDATLDLGTTTAFLQALSTFRRATDLSPPSMLGLAGTAKNPEGFVIPADNPFNPFGQDVTLERSVNEAGGQTTTTTGSTIRLVAGLDGDWNDLSWSISGNHGESRNDYATSGQVDLTRALQSAATADWFGPGSLTPQTLDNLVYTAHAKSAYQEDVLQAGVNAPLARLPGGAATVRAGLEARWESGSTSVDAITRAGDQSGPDAAPTQGGYATREAYLDLALPILKTLSASLAARETGTDRYGGTLSLRGGVSWSPVPSLRLRASAGSGHRPPAITEAFGGITPNFLPVSDPCDPASGLRGLAVVDANCRSLGLGPGFRQQSALIDVASGGNPKLSPEASRNQSFGAVLAPAAWPGFSLAIDWWRVRVDHAIDSLADTDPNLIPDTCLRSAGLSSPLCALIGRTGGGPQSGQISRILALDENIGTIRTSGIDFDLTAAQPLGAFGTLHLDGQATWLLDYKIAEIGQSGATQYAGTFPGLSGVGLYARLRGRVEATLDTGPWSFSWTARASSGGRVLDDPGPYANAPAILYQDITASRSFGRVTLMAGIDNLGDVAPPRLIDGLTNTDTNIYDVVGIFGWTRVVANF
jgi:outer membrane receptor protein involved in Fe transport